MVIRIPERNVVNRPSKMQSDILDILKQAGQPIGNRIGHLPRTGEIVDALGLPRDKKSFASVSRSLARLVTAGLVIVYFPEICTRGKGGHWAVRP